MSHSPGPWRWVPFLHWDGGLQSADGKYVISNDETDSTPENKADAALIASAPELLSMLRELEWNGCDNAAEPACPVCCAYAPDAIGVGDNAKGAHAPDCRLAALLGRFK